MGERPRLRTYMFTLLGLIAAHYMITTLPVWRHTAWVFDAGEVASAPAVCPDGSVVTTSTHTLVALDGRTGQRRWTFTFPDRQEYPSSDPEADADGAVYVTTHLAGKPHRVYALDGATGSRKWEREGGDLSVLGERGMLLTGGERVTAIRTDKGKRLWQFRPPRRDDIYPNSWNSNGYVEAIASGSDAVYVTFGCPYKTLYALDARSGVARWSAPLNDTEQFGCSVPTDVSVSKTGIPLVSQIGGSVTAYNPVTGRVLWQSKRSKCFWSAELLPIPENGFVVGYDDGLLVALDARTGRERWTRNLHQNISRRPALAPDGALHVGTETNRAFAVDLASGNVRRHLFLGWPFGGFMYPDHVSITVGRGGMAYAASTDGRLRALRAP